MGNLTYFDRYETANVAMSKLVSLNIAEHPDQEDIDVLCLGCSTGQTSLDLLTELYVELGKISDGVRRRVHMVSLDIDPRVIELARKGEYVFDSVKEDMSGSKVLRAPWMQFDKGRITVNFDKMQDLGWSLDYRQFDVDKDLRLACPDGGKGFDIVELMNCHNKEHGASQVENVGRVMKPRGLMYPGRSFLEYQYAFCREEGVLPERIPRSTCDFMRTCTDVPSLRFISGAVENRAITEEEALLLSQLKFADMVLPNHFRGLQVLEGYYALKHFSDYLYGFKDADESEKKKIVESSDMLRYLHGSARWRSAPLVHEWALELYRKNEDPEKQRNLDEFIELSVKTA